MVKWRQECCCFTIFFWNTDKYLLRPATYHVPRTTYHVPRHFTTVAFSFFPSSLTSTPALLKTSLWYFVLMDAYHIRRIGIPLLLKDLGDLRVGEVG
jgi:hypothetical protein